MINAPPLCLRRRLEVVLRFELRDEIIASTQLILRWKNCRNRGSHAPLAGRRRSHCVFVSKMVLERGMCIVAMKIGIR